MLPQYGIKLAVHIISADFGNLAAKVCECLLRRGILSRLAIARHTELENDQVTMCLCVLIQHNCVQAFCLVEEGGYGEPDKKSTQYMALFNNMICRLRFPKLLTVVSQKLDRECVSIFEGLLQHGRLTLPQVLDRANKGEIVHERFMKLVEARYIEQCPDAEPLVPLITEESAPKKRGVKSNKIAVKEVTLQDRVIDAATLMETERFSLETRTERKRKISEADCDVDVSDFNKDPTWRVNFDEFKHLFRKKACVECAQKRLDDEAGIGLSAFLDATKATRNTVSFSINPKFEEIIKSEEGCKMNLEDVWAFFVQLGCNSVDPDGSYTLDLAETIKHLQREEVESIVLKRYGKEAYRLLAKNRHPVETSGISGQALVEDKETKKLLYKMWIENYLHMEFVRRPQQGDLFFWSVNRNLNYLVLDELFHSALNLRIRVAYEIDRVREVFRLRGKQKHNAEERFEAIKKLLDSSLAKLDDAIMIFPDF